MHRRTGALGVWVTLLPRVTLLLVLVRVRGPVLLGGGPSVLLPRVTLLLVLVRVRGPILLGGGASVLLPRVTLLLVLVRVRGPSILLDGGPSVLAPTPKLPTSLRPWVTTSIALLLRGARIAIAIAGVGGWGPIAARWCPVGVPPLVWVALVVRLLRWAALLLQALVLQARLGPAVWRVWCPVPPLLLWVGPSVGALPLLRVPSLVAGPPLVAAITWAPPPVVLVPQGLGVGQVGVCHNRVFRNLLWQEAALVLLVG